VDGYADTLLRRRNPDKGWGYYAGKSSWLEPTVLAALALHGHKESDEAWGLIRGWQAESGAWVANPRVGAESWATSLVVVLHCVRGEFDDRWKKGLGWLLRMKGKQAPGPTLIDRLLQRKQWVEQDNTLDGWPWAEGTANWVEPTAHVLRALRLSLPGASSDLLRQRIEMGERYLLDRRCKDGGWNYGNRRVLDEDLPSFPECTALALIGLEGGRGMDLAVSLARAKADWGHRQPGLSGALLRIGMRMHGLAFEDRRPEITDRTETTQVALALIGEMEGTWRQWRGGTA